jgi:hypothetical protein
MRPCTVITITLVAFVLAFDSVVQAADNQAGIWKLNIAKSKYSPGPAPKEGTLTIEAISNGLKIMIHGTDAEGHSIHFEASPKFDGKDYPMTGNPIAGMLSMKRTDDYTIESTGKKDGKPVMTVRSVVAKDGKTRTTTQTGKNAKGQAVHNILVYDRQ